MSLKLHRPTPDGLEPAPPETHVEPLDWRTRLRSRRWDPALLENREADKTSPLAGILFFAALAFVTLVVLILGYGTGFWA